MFFVFLAHADKIRQLIVGQVHPVVVEAGQCFGISYRDVDMKLDDLLNLLYRRLVGIYNFTNGSGEFLGNLDDNEHKDFLFGFDVVVQTRRLDVHGLRDVTHGYRTIAFFFEKLGGYGDDFCLAVGWLVQG